MRYLLLTLILIISSFSLTGCTSKVDFPAIEVQYGSSKAMIKKRRFQKIFINYKRIYIINNKNEKIGKTISMTALRKKYVESIVKSLKRKCLLTNNNFQISNKEAQKCYDDYVNTFKSKEEFEKSIKEFRTTKEQIFNNAKRECIEDKIIKTFNTAKITEEEIKKYYEEHKYEYITEKKIHINHILIITNYNTIKRLLKEKNKKLNAEELDKQARKIHDERAALVLELQEKLAQNPKNFENYAKIYSQDEKTAKNGGEMLDYVEFSPEYPSEFHGTIIALNNGEISKPVLSKYGTHFILKKGITPEKTTPLSELREQIKKQLYKENRHNYLDKAIESQESKFKVIYHDKRLDPNYKRGKQK